MTISQKNRKLASMKKLYIFILCSFTVIATNAQIPAIDFTKILGLGSTQAGDVTAVHSIARDAQDNIYISGRSPGIIDTILGGTTYMRPDGDTMNNFIYKFDSLGNKVLGFTLKNLRSTIVPRNNEGFYLISKSSVPGIIDMDPGPGNYFINATNNEYIVSSYDHQANILWSFALSSYFVSQSGYSAGVDFADNLYFYGIFADSLDIDPSPNVQYIYANTNPNLSSHNAESFICKYSPAGNLVWGYGLDSVEHINADIGRCLAVKNNYIHILGNMLGTFDADFSTSSSFLYPTTGRKFIASYDLNGNLVNAFNFGDTSIISVWSHHNHKWIDADSANNLYIGGFNTVGDFDPNPNQQYNINPNGRTYGFGSYTMQGQLRWYNTLEYTSQPTSNLGAVGAHVNNAGNIILSYQFRGQIDFDPGPNTNLHPLPIYSGGGYFTAFSKYNNKGYYSGSFEPIAINNAPNQYHVGAIIDESCNLYTAGHWRSSILTLESALGPISYSIPNFNNSRAVVVKYSDDYPINPIVQNDTAQIRICAGDSITINVSGTGTLNWYDAPTGGNLVYTGISNPLSTLNANTTLYVEEVSCNAVSGRTKVEIMVTPVNNSVTVSSDTLTANQNNASYQWIDCITNLPLPNETNQFISGQYGTFAVDITTGGCTRRSPCINLWPNSVSSIRAVDKIKLYPNPSNDFIILELVGNQKEMQYQILDPMGKQIILGNTQGDKTNIDIASLAKGVYFLSVEQLGVLKFIKE